VRPGFQVEVPAEDHLFNGEGPENDHPQRTGTGNDLLNGWNGR